MLHLDGEIQDAWAPQPGPQTLFVACPVFECFFGGSRGGGKTDSVLGEWVSHASQYGENAVGLMVRRTRVELLETFERARAIYSKIGATATYSPMRFTMANGARITYAYLDRDSDAEQFQGQSLSRVYVEEVGNFPSPQPIMKLMATLRSGTGVPVGMRLTGNPGGAGHCLPFGEVLTPVGWRDIAAMQVGDPVYSVAEDGELVTAVVAQKHTAHYDGEMVSVRARGFRMVCTPNHSVAKVGGVKRDLDKAFSLVPFDDLPGQATILRSVRWTGKPLGTVVVERSQEGRRKHDQPVGLDGIDYCALLGWMLSEGHTVERDRAFGISQTKPAGRLAIRELLDRCGFVGSWHSNGVTVYAPSWWEHFRQFGLCRDKFIPPEVKGATPAELGALMFTMMAGDGHWASENGGAYYTTSARLADDFAEIALKLGYIVHQVSRQREDRDGLSYHVNIKKKITGGTELLTGNHVYAVATETKRRSDIERHPYSGMVYCLGIDGTHTFVVRQEGAVWISGNSWVRARYIDPAPQGWEIITDDKTGLERIYIPSRVTDNAYLGPDYVQRLKASGSPELVRAWLDGDWSVVSGAFFPEFSLDRHVIAPRVLPQHWARFRSFDWGSARPFCCQWWAVSDGSMPDIARGALVLYREWYGMRPGEPNVGLKMTAEAVAAGIREREQDDPDQPLVGVADPAMFAEDGGPSIAQRMMQGGVIFRPADNKRVPARGAMGGWDQLRSRLVGDDDGKPMILFFSTARDLIRTLPAMQHDDARPEDLQTESEDHSVDACRYAVMARAWVKDAPKAVVRDSWDRAFERASETEEPRSWRTA